MGVLSRASSPSHLGTPVLSALSAASTLLCPSLNPCHFPHFHKLFCLSEEKCLHLLITALIPFASCGCQPEVGQRDPGRIPGRRSLCVLGGIDFTLQKPLSSSPACPACPPAMHSTVENALIRISDRFSEVQTFQVFLVPPSLAIPFHPLSSHFPCTSLVLLCFPCLSEGK